MNRFIEDCRREWRRLRVPTSAANDMTAELESDLAEAAAEGVAPEAVVGSDPRTFAASWAAERGVARGPRRLLPVAALSAFLAVAIAGAALALVASPAHTGRAAGPSTLIARNASPTDASVVSVWIKDPLPAGSASDDDARTVGIVLLLVGAGGVVSGAAVWLSMARRPSLRL